MAALQYSVDNLTAASNFVLGLIYQYLYLSLLSEQSKLLVFCNEH